MIAFYILIHAWNKEFFTIRTFKITGSNFKHRGRRYTRYRYCDREHDQYDPYDRGQVRKGRYYNERADGNDRDYDGNHGQCHPFSVFLIFFH